jgi:DnaJ-domain-containing protein 1
LEDDPARVVADLRQRQQRLERPGSQHRQGRRTRTDQRSTDQRRSDRQTHQHSAADPAPADADPSLLAALQVLGLRSGASREAIKDAHRRLVKRHHPDMGGQAADFHRINAAYQLLLA